MSDVSRSVYQKVVEENRRLLTDIRLLTQSGMSSAEKILCVIKWQKVFKEEQEKIGFMKAILGVKK